MKHNRLKKRCSAVALNVLIAVLAILWLVPVFWLVVSSFRAEQGAYTSYLWPKGFTLNNYVRLFTDRRLFDFPRWFGNTMLVAGCSCVITTILTLDGGLCLFPASVPKAEISDECLPGAGYVPRLHEHDRHLSLHEGGKP